MVKTFVAATGRLDVAFNNAGIIAPAAALADIEDDDWDRVMDVD